MHSITSSFLLSSYCVLPLRDIARTRGKAQWARVEQVVPGKNLKTRIFRTTEKCEASTMTSSSNRPSMYLGNIKYRSRRPTSLTLHHLTCWLPSASEKDHGKGQFAALQHFGQVTRCQKNVAYNQYQISRRNHEEHTIADISTINNALSTQP